MSFVIFRSRFFLLLINFHLFHLCIKYYNNNHYMLIYFIRARFRNHRTIFNSPHPRLMHIKLGKKKGRRRASHTSLEAPQSRQLSICSQLSPLQSRRGNSRYSSKGQCSLSILSLYYSCSVEYPLWRKICLIYQILV